MGTVISLLCIAKYSASANTAPVSGRSAPSLRTALRPTSKSIVKPWPRPGPGVAPIRESTLTTAPTVPAVYAARNVCTDSSWMLLPVNSETPVTVIAASAAASSTPSTMPLT